MSKIYVLADESLGGVMREYVEVERDAKEGDYIITNVCSSVLRIKSSDEDVAYTEGDAAYYHEYYRTLEPTDIIHIELADSDDDVSATYRCRMVDRKAEVGERVIVIAEGVGWYDDKIGETFEVISGEAYGFNAEVDLHNGEVYVESGRNSSDNCSFISFDNYRVLVPVESESAPENITDVIANLVRRVNGLEAELNTYKAVEKQRKDLLDYNIVGIKDDIETWSREIESAKYSNEEICERLGYVEKYVDEHFTAELRDGKKPQTITLDVDLFAKLIGGER